MKKKIIALALAACTMLPTAVTADQLLIASNPNATMPDSIKDAILQVEDCETLKVTSSLSSDTKLNTSLMLDGSTDTKFTVDLSGKENKTFSIYTASSVPEQLTMLGIIFELDGSKVSVSVYGTNDSLRESWDKLDIEIDGKNGKYTMIDVDAGGKYGFYRIDIRLREGDTFSISEMRLLKPYSEGPDYMYDLGSSVKPGETPDIIPIPGTGKEEEKAEMLPNRFYMGGFFSALR